MNSFSGSADGDEVCGVGGDVETVALAGHSNETKTVFETNGKPHQLEQLNSNPAPPRPAPFRNRSGGLEGGVFSVFAGLSGVQ